MAVDIFHPVSLKKAVDKIETPPLFLKDSIFRKGIPHPSDLIDINSLSGTITAAPLTAPGSPAKVINKRGHDADFIQFPSIRMKTPFNSSELLRVDVTNPDFLKAINVNQMLADKITRQLTELKQKADARVEIMCSQLLLTGIITYTNVADGYTYTTDFGRDTATYNISRSTAAWGSGTAKIAYDFDTVIKLLRGHVDFCIMSDSSWLAAQDDADFMTHLDNRRIDFGSLSMSGSQMWYRGTYKGIDIYWYPETIDDDEGDTTTLITADYCIFSSRKNDFFYDFGLVNEVNAGSGNVTDLFTKTYTKEDPSGKILLMETNPLPMCKNINKIVKLYTGA